MLAFAMSAAAVVSGAVYASSTLLPWRGVFDGGGVSMWRVAPAEIALTFDDGPDPERTPRVLDALARAGAVATFFLIGKLASRYPAVVRRIVAEGHAVGNHTFDHPTLLWRSTAFVERELDLAQQAIFDACGVSPDVVRAPFGRRDATFYRVAARRSLLPVFWSRDSLDWTGAAAARVAARVGSARGGDIVLMHDGAVAATATAAALSASLPRLSERGLLPRRLLSGSGVKETASSGPSSS